MRKTHKLFAILLFPFLLSMQAVAEQTFYVGGGVGGSYIEEENVINGEDFEESDTAFKAFAGYRFFDYFAVQVDYLDFGEPDDEIFGIETEIDLSAVALYGVGILPIGERFQIFGKLGIAYWDAEVEASNFAISASDDEDGTDVALGFGGSFAVTDFFAVRAEYDFIDVDGLDAAGMVTASGEFRF